MKTFKNTTSALLGFWFLIAGSIGLIGFNANADREQTILSAQEVNVYQLLTTSTKRESKGSGTGFWIDDRTMVTNCHVAQNVRRMDRNHKTGEMDTTYKHMWAINGAGVKFEMAVNSCNVERDLAILTSLRPNPDVIPVTLAKPATFAQKIHSTGYGLAAPLSYKEGFVGSVLNTPEKGVFRRMATILVAPGDSGSPVFNDKGEIQGVISSVAGGVLPNGRVIQMSGKTLYIPVTELKAELEEVMGE